MASSQSSAQNGQNSASGNGGASAPTPPAAGTGSNAAASTGRKKRDPNAPRKASPKVKALSEVRTYLLQRRDAELQGKTGTSRAIEAERFDRMLDAVENIFPPGHTHNIPRDADGGASASA